MRVAVRLQPTEPEKAGIGVGSRRLTLNGQFSIYEVPDRKIQPLLRDSDARVAQTMG